MFKFCVGFYTAKKRKEKEKRPKVEASCIVTVSAGDLRDEAGVISFSFSSPQKQSYHKNLSAVVLNNVTRSFTAAGVTQLSWR